MSAECYLGPDPLAPVLGLDVQILHVDLPPLPPVREAVQDKPHQLVEEGEFLFFPIKIIYTNLGTQFSNEAVEELRFTESVLLQDLRRDLGTLRHLLVVRQLLDE